MPIRFFYKILRKHVVLTSDCGESEDYSSNGASCHQGLQLADNHSQCSMSFSKFLGTFCITKTIKFGASVETNLHSY